MKQFKNIKALGGKLIACAVASVMCLSLNVKGVMAAPPPPTTSGTEANPATLGIWKNIQMPTGTATPAGTATFQFTAVSVDGENATTTNMPAIPNRTVTFTAGDTGTTATDVSGVKTVSKKTGNILDSVTFAHAGEYIYTVTESASGFTLVNTATVSEQMDYSTMTYRVQVIVANNAANTGVYVQTISVGVYDPTTATVGTKVNDTDTAEGTGFGFTNKFNRTHTGSATDPSAALEISKTVSGGAGNTATYFPFTLTVNDPATLTTTTTHGTYKAIIVSGGAAVDPTLNGITGASARDHSFDVTAGAAFTFKLKHGQSLAFINLPVGATYTTTETDAQGHTANLKITSNGVAATETATATSGAAKNVTEGADIAAFRNNKTLATPTGIILSNLPYILLVGFACAVIATVVIKKNREA